MFFYVTHQKLATGARAPLLVPLARSREVCMCMSSLLRARVPARTALLAPHSLGAGHAALVCCKGRMACPPCLLHVHRHLMFSGIYTVACCYGGSAPPFISRPYQSPVAPPNSRVPYRAWLLIDIPRIANGMVRVSRRRPSHYERSVRRPAVDKVISLDSFTHRRLVLVRKPSSTCLQHSLPLSKHHSSPAPFTPS